MILILPIFFFAELYSIYLLALLVLEGRRIHPLVKYLPLTGYVEWYRVKQYKKTVITRWDDTPYLIRYTLFSCKAFSVKVHRILESDDACMHDHPWAFYSLILKGGYIEHRMKDITTVSRWYGVGSILKRKAMDIHRLELLPGRTATSLVVTFKRVRPWGFYTREGWIFWKNYKQKNTEQC